MRRKAEILCQMLYVSFRRLLKRTFFTPFCSLRAVCVQLKGDLVQYISHIDRAEQVITHLQFQIHWETQITASHCVVVGYLFTGTEVLLIAF